MIYITVSGQKYEADGPDDLVNQLRNSSFEKSADVTEFIKKSAARAAVQSNSKVRSDTAEHYVKDCIDLGLLKIME